jgi:hypothetical protein
MKASAISNQDSDITRHHLRSKIRRQSRKMLALPSIGNTPGEARQIVGNMKASQDYSHTQLVDSNQFPSHRVPKNQAMIRQ